MEEKDIEKDVGYKLHCCDIMLSEIQIDINACKDLTIYRQILKNDFDEIIAHFYNKRGMFLLGNYFKR
jgi:hypothetical protein